MKNLLWNLFLKSGSIDAFLGYKEFEKVGAEDDMRKKQAKERELTGL